jgi:hypothetical protein
VLVFLATCAAARVLSKRNNVGKSLKKRPAVALGRCPGKPAQPRLQAKHPVTKGKNWYLAGAQIVRKCHTSADSLIWFYFQSTKETWPELCRVVRDDRLLKVLPNQALRRLGQPYNFQSVLILSAAKTADRIFVLAEMRCVSLRELGHFLR